MRRMLLAFFTVMFLVLTVRTEAQPVDMEALVASLKQGGYVLVLRHGATNDEQADTDPLNHDNVTQQRLLSNEGKQVSVQLGQAFTTLGIPLGAVYTSKFQRAIETGTMMSGGEVTTTLDLTEGGLVVSPRENRRRAEAMRRMAGTLPEAGKNTLLVSHKPNILEAFGKDWFDLQEGEMSIFKPDETGKGIFIARIQALEWIKAAHKP